MIGPWFLGAFLTATGLGSLDYVILLPPVDTCVARVRTRRDHDFTDEDATRHMHDQFVRSQIAARHVMAGANVSVEVLAEQVITARRHGHLTYPALPGHYAWAEEPS